VVGSAVRVPAESRPEFDVASINDSLDISQPTPALNALNIENDNAGVSIVATSKSSQGTAGLLTTILQPIPINYDLFHRSFDLQ
jgi:hypothetical protein